MKKRPEVKPDLSAPSLAVVHVVALKKGKSYYEQADLSLAEIRKLVKVGSVITLPDSAPVPADLRGAEFELRDKFADRDSISVGQNARRFELKRLKKPKALRAQV